jgi:hypothetical protein
LCKGKINLKITFLENIMPFGIDENKIHFGETVTGGVTPLHSVKFEMFDTVNEEYLLLGYKIPVRTSQETLHLRRRPQSVSAI